MDTLFTQDGPEVPDAGIDRPTVAARQPTTQ
jgi:hypothetical protein